MGRMSRNKGKRGEREWAAKLREHGFEARRGVQHAGGPDSPDVVSDMEGYHAEVKRVERLLLYPSLEQSKHDAGEGEIPYVAHRPNGKEWVVVLRGEDFLNMTAKLLGKDNDPLS